VNEEAQAIFLNAIPLLALSALYLAATAVLAPALWRERGRLHDAELALALVFPSAAFAGGIIGMLVLVSGRPLASNGWVGLVAILAAFIPALVFLAVRGDVALKGGRRALDAQGRDRLVRERGGASAFTGELSRAPDVEAIARLLVERTALLLGVEFASLTLVEGGRARGVLGLLEGEEVPWWHELDLDLDEPSAIASAVFEAAPFAVYDVGLSPHVNREIAQTVGAKSGVWIPVVADGRVIAVLAVATTRSRRAFSPEEVSLVQGLAAEAGLALERARSGSALEEALARERLVARVSHKVRSELDVESVLATAVEETAAAVGVSRCFVRLGEPSGGLPIAAEWAVPGLEPVGDRAARLSTSVLAARERRTVAIADVEDAPELADPSLGGLETLRELGTRSVLATPIVLFDEVKGVFSLHRTEPGRWSEHDLALAQAIAHEAGLALHIARLLGENRRRFEQQAALVGAAQALTSELDLQSVIGRLVDEVVKLLGADAADCWIYDRDRRVLRCRAVHGLPAGEVGRELAPEGAIGEAIGLGRALLQRDPPPGDGHDGFAEIMDAPISSAGEARGVLGVRSLETGRFDEGDLDVLEAFASLAALALRNAEAFEERSRQARVQRGFYRIATVLGQPLSLAGTLDALVEAASDALGGSFAAVLMPGPGGLEPVAAQDLPESLAGALAPERDPAESVLRTAAAEGRIVASTDVEADNRFGEEWRRAAVEAGCRSLLAIPVERAPDGDGSGLVLVFFSQEHGFTDDDLELAEHLAGAARGSLERSRLYEEERVARTLAQQLARTGSLLATELDPSSVLDEVVRQAPRLVGVEACAIRVLDDDELVINAVEGEFADALLGTRSPATAWLSGDVAQSRTPLAIEDGAADERLAAVDPLLRLGYHGYLGVPLSGPADSLHGVLAVYSRAPKRWRDAEIEALLALAGNASAALSNAELYQRVALEKERSFAILANIADGIVAVDRDGRVVLWNNAAEQITGVPAEEALGRTPLQLLGRNLESEGEIGQGDRLVSILRGSEEIWLSVTEAIMRDPTGAVAGRIHAFRDISADRLVEEMKSDFVSTVSQELRRPLTSIYGFAETLLRRDVLFEEEERRTFLGYIASESERLTAIVDALLNVARLDTGDLQVSLAPTDVGAILSEVVSAVTDAGNVNGHRFVVDLPDEPVAAEADPDKLRQVVANLLDNAVKFSPAGGTVTVAARRRRYTVEVSVADEGVGIPQAEQQRIFRKFYRGDAGAARESGGTGLGLFIVEGLVSAMGGRVWVTSAEGEGASFTFELPLAEIPHAALESEVEARRV
jgi:PAS domain S-box-containing protein